MKPRILIVEDEPFSAARLSQQLCELGYEPVAISAMGEEAELIAGKLQFDLALVDLRLAGEMDGITLALKLRDHYAVPSILITGVPDKILIERAILAQPYGYISKPFSTQVLNLTIEMALQRLHAETALRQREKQLEDVLHTSMDSFWIVSVDGHILEVNDAACRMTGFSRDELLQMNLAQLEYNRTAEQITAGINRILEAGAVQIERLTKRKDGEVRLIDMSVMCSPPPIRRLYCFGRDITERRRAEQALRESERNLRATLDSMPDAAWLKDSKGKYLAVNAVWCKMYGQLEKHVIGKTDFDFFPETLAREYFSRDEKVRLSGKPYQTELGHVKPNGDKLWLEICKAPVFGPDNQCVGLIGITRDITERRNAEKELLLLNRAVEQSPASIVITATNGDIQYVNPYFEKHTGYSSREVIGRNPRILNSGTHPPEFFKNLWDTIKAGNEWRGEIRNRRKDGTFFWEQASISPVRDENGQIANYVAVKEDITERKATELTMAWQAALFANSADICCVKDLNLRVLTANQAMARAAGVTGPEMLVGKTDAEIFGTHQSTGAANAYMEDERIVQKYHPGQYLERQERLLTASNEERTLFTRKFPVFDSSGKLIATANISADITELKRAELNMIRAKEEAEAANKAKSIFLATMSHELRTPLNVINGMAAVLSQENWPPEQKHSLDLISEGGNTLLTIIEEILDYADLNAGKTKLAEKPFSVLSIAGSALRLFTASARSKGISLTCSLDPQIPAELVGDPHHIQQVLVNILHNAVKFTAHGRIQLRVVTRKIEDDLCWLEFSIRDTGIGIAPENQQKLFKPFSQADDTITRRFGGAGMGLAIAKSYVDLMGGAIGVRSRLNRGSEFYFKIRLPVAKAAHAFQAIAHPNFSKRRVFVARKNGAAYRMLLSLLRAWDMQPVIAEPQAIATTVTACDLAVLPAELGASFDQGEPLPSCPIVWYGRAEALGGRALSVPHVKLASYIDPLELSDAFGDLLNTTSPSAIPARRNHPPPAPPVQGLSILAAEDHITNREVLKLVLKHLGYQADMVVNGAEALEAVQRKKYDVLLLDVQMPIMDGLTVATEICRLYPDPTKRVKMIALTANALAGDRERCLAAGMDAYLSKPVLPADLRASIQQLFSISDSNSSGTPVLPTKTSQISDFPVLDLAHLQTITAGMNQEQVLETLTQLHASVCNDYQETLPQVLELCKLRNQTRFAETVHGLKGCFLMTGWTRAGKRCAKAIIEARQSNFSDWAVFPDELKTLFALSSKAMTKHLNERSDSLRANAESTATANISPAP